MEKHVAMPAESESVYILRKLSHDTISLSQWIQGSFKSRDLHSTFKSQCEKSLLSVFSSQQVLEEARASVSTILELLTEVGEEMKDVDHVMAFIPQLAGSCKEGTKINEFDEADVVCLLHYFTESIKSGKIRLGACDANNPEFVTIECGEDVLKSETVNTTWNMFNEDGFLKRGAIFQRFYWAFNKVIHKRCIWKKYQNLYRFVVHDICSSEKNIKPIHLIWNGRYLKCQHISVDIVPAFDFSSMEVPRQCKHHPLLS